MFYTCIMMVWLCVYSQNSDATQYFRSTGQYTGLNADIILDITFDKQGVMWLASRDGLYRYDSASVSQIKYADGLSDSDIRQISLGPDGLLWVATNSGGLNVYDPVHDEVIKHFGHQKHSAQSLSNNSIYDVAFIGEQVWVATQHGLNRMAADGSNLTRFFHNPDDLASLSHNYTYSLYTDEQQQLWVATVGGGVSRFNAADGQFENIVLSERTQDPMHDDVFAVQQINQEHYLFATRKGLFLYNLRTDSLEKVPAPSSVEPGITDLLLVDNTVYMSTLAQGVLAYDVGSGVLSYINSAPLGSVSQLPSIPALSLAAYQSQLFVGTWGKGLFASPIGYDELDARLSRSNEMGDNANLTSLLMSEQQVVAGSFGAGLLFDSSGNELAAAAANNSLSWYQNWLDAVKRYPELKRTGVLAARYSDRFNELYLGTTEGLWVINFVSNSLTKYNQVQALQVGYVNAIELTANGDVWFASGGNGLMQLASNGGYLLAFNDHNKDQHNLSGEYITQIHLDKGLLWVGTRSNGLNRCSLKPLLCELVGSESSIMATLNITDVAHLDDKVIFSSRGGGVFAYDKATRAIKRYGRAHGLASNVALSLLVDSDNSVWVTTSEGLSRISADGTRIYNYPSEAMLGVSQFNTHSSASTDEHLYFGALEGLVRIAKGTVIPSTRDYDLLTRAQVRSGEKSQVLAQSRAHEIAPQSVVQLSFTLLDYADKKTHFEYRMKDTEPWQDIGVGQQLTLYHLSPDDYQISVRGRDHAGNWQQSDTLELTVYPHFWQTLWFQLTVAFSTLLLMWMLHELRTRRLANHNRVLQRLQKQKQHAFDALEQQQQELEQTYTGLRRLTEQVQQAKEQERLNISRELHDEIGQNLTACKLNLQMSRQASAEDIPVRIQQSIDLLNKIIKQTRDVSRSLRPPQLDELGVLVALQSLFDETQRLTGITIKSDFSAQCEHSLGEFNALIFRFVQESIHNALKHASASVITVSINCTEKEVEVAVTDNGRGINQEDMEQRMRSGEHLGLLGMRERLVHVGGTLNIASKENEGCTVTARIPL